MSKKLRGSCEYYKDFFNKDIYGDKQITGSGIQKFGNHITSINEHITIKGFKYLANKARIDGHQKETTNVDDCLPEKRCILTFMFDNENKGIGEVGFFDYLDQVEPVISFKSYEKICNNICKSTHLLISETIETSNEDDETSINGKNNYSIVYSVIINKKSPPYNTGKTVFTIDEYTKFVDENKNKNPTELPRLNLFVNIDNFVKTELSYTEWLKTQLKTSPTVESSKTDVLPTVELPKTDESPKTDQLSTGDDDKDGPPPEYDRDPPPGYDDQNYTTGPTSEDDKNPPSGKGGARSRRCRKDRKNKSRRCRKSKRRNNKKRRRNTRR
jgi:hypothetical protein